MITGCEECYKENKEEAERKEAENRGPLPGDVMVREGPPERWAGTSRYELGEECTANNVKTNTDVPKQEKAWYIPGTDSQCVGLDINNQHGREHSRRHWWRRNTEDVTHPGCMGKNFDFSQVSFLNSCVSGFLCFFLTLFRILSVSRLIMMLAASFKHNYFLC